jgi:hypothetical protein
VKRTEQAEHRAVINHLHARGVKGAVFWHTPSGGYRSPIEAAILKGMGARSGFPDLFILHEGKLFGLELKAAKGRMSLAQINTHVELERAGAIMGAAYGLDEALVWLEKHKLLRGTAS